MRGSASAASSTRLRGVALRLVCLVLVAIWVLLLIRVIFSWLPRPPDPLRPIDDFTRRVTDPVLVPLRRAIPPVRLGAVALDVSILVAFFAIVILQGLFC